MADETLKQKLRGIERVFEKEEPKRFRKIFKSMPENSYERLLERRREQARERAPQVFPEAAREAEEGREMVYEGYSPEEIEQIREEESDEDLRLRRLMERYKPRGF
jgi:SOS response regulatory protein OraA/RecX